MSELLGHEQDPAEKLKAVQMPPRDIILQKLREIGVYGVTPQTDEFYDEFVKSAADREIYGGGLNMAWVLASIDTLGPYSAIVNGDFEEVIDAITPDPEVAEQAKEFRRKVLEKIEEERKAREPKVEDLGSEDSLHNFKRFSQLLRISEIMRDYIEEGSDEEESVQDRINPYYNQTHRGFFLEDYYGTPNCLHTPWGEYSLRQGARFTGNHEEFLERLGAKICKPEVNNGQGTFGPVYRIHKIDDEELPSPVERPGSVYKDYEEVHRDWDQLVDQYYETLGQAAPLTALEKIALDDAILEARGQAEPPISEEDVRNLKGLEQLQGQVVKYTQDGGETWHYTKLGLGPINEFNDGSMGYSADEEVMPNAQVHSSYAITDKRFKNGLIVRPTSKEEVEGMRFSYDFSDDEDL